MQYRAWFRCTRGEHGQWSLEDVIYRCPTCDGLLEVAHDLDALRALSPQQWMRLFEDRYKRTIWPYGSGVWGKKEWVAPQLDDENVVSLDEERKAQMVSNLLVVLCGDRATQPVVNTGTLYG